MSEEAFQHGGDRFPPTRRSVIEAVRSIDAEERDRVPQRTERCFYGRRDVRPEVTRMH